jgi:hypothetical protein
LVLLELELSGDAREVAGADEGEGNPLVIEGVLVRAAVSVRLARVIITGGVLNLASSHAFAVSRQS